MKNTSNNASYLILYLIIILVLIYTITFISTYTCNISPQPIDFFANEGFKNYDNQIEKFESASVNWNNAQMATDYPGNDISSGNSTSLQDCGNQCISNSQCNAFVTNADGTYCWLKGNLSSPIQNSDRNTYLLSRTGAYATGLKVGNPQIGIDYPGNDIINQGVNSAQDCATACQNKPGCNAFVTNLAGNYCWLKDSLGHSTSNSDRVSYKFNRTPPGTMESPPISDNDFTLIAVGYANQVYLQDVIGGQWFSNSTVLQNSQAVIDLSVMSNGSLIGVGTNNQLYSRKTLNSPWVNMNISGQFYAVSVANDDHTLMLVGKNNNIYLYDLNTPNNQVILVDNVHFIIKIIQLQNGQFVAIGTDTYLYIGNGTFNPYTISWSQVKTNNCCAKSIAQAPNGSIILLDTNGKIQVASSIGASWTMTQVCCFSAISVMPIPPQRIMEYERKGAFIDSNNRTIPNLLGNFNTLSECISAAKSQGYNTVGYQYMNYCFGGNNSPYDTYGFQTDNTKSISAYPGDWTNIVYKTTDELISTQDPAEGQVFIYEKCQFAGGGSKMEIGNYSDFGYSVPIQSIKIGINTNVELYELPNYQGKHTFISGYSDVVNKIFNCFKVGSGNFTSAKVIANKNAMPYNSSDLTNAQLVNLWTSAGCNAESNMIRNEQAIANWKGKIYKTTAEVEAEMKAWATDNNPVHKNACYMSTVSEDYPAEGEVVLFENCNYEGRYKKFGLGNFADVGSDFNDITSAIRIGPYTSVTIYENTNFTGKSITFKNDTVAVSGIACFITNNFNDMLSSLKVNPAFEPVNNFLSLQADDVVILGSWNTPPWNLSNFVDTTAKWIWWNDWNGQFPKGNAPIDTKPVRFQLLVPISGNLDIPIVIHVIADNASQNANIVKVNNKIVGQIEDSGWINSKYTQIQTMLAPGNNLVEFDVQNIGGSAGLLVSIINTNTNNVVINSGSGKWGWIDPSKVVSATMSEIESNLVIHDEAVIGKIIKIKDIKDLQQISVGGTFRLFVELKDVPPYIKGQQFYKGDTNQFYLAIEKLDPNCSVMEENGCLNLYADNKKCNNSALTNISKKNSFRLVLVSKDYVLDPDIPFGKNVDFTMAKIGDKYYLKNIQTGFMPRLYKNDFTQDIYGYMDTSYLSNYNSLNKNTNILCKNDKPKPVNNKMEQENKISTNVESEFISCTTNADGNLYLMTTSNLLESNPINFVINKDGSVSISLQMFNFYGTPDQSYSLVYCNFNINTYAYIEKLTNPLGTFLVNMVCFDSDKKRRLPNNTLNFYFEISKYPTAYLKEKNIYNLNN